MKLARILVAALISASIAFPLHAGPAGTHVVGKVTLSGTPAKPKALDLSKEPICVKLHASAPLYPENVLTGPGNTLRNVVVYVSAGAPPVGPTSAGPVVFDQLDCHYTTHVLAFRVGQEVKISNSDPLSHNIHPIARVNREWNKIQLPGTPPFSYAFDSEEFIPVKCNIHPWMQGYFAVLKTPFFAVTGDDGGFALPELPPGHYTVTAWHETFGTQSKEITVTAGEEQTVNFTFVAKP
jgi:plastocyanin